MTFVNLIMKEKKLETFYTRLFSKFRDLCSWQLQSISCVLAAVNQTLNDFFIQKNPKGSLSFNHLNITERTKSFLPIKIYKARFSQERAVFSHSARLALLSALTYLILFSFYPL